MIAKNLLKEAIVIILVLSIGWLVGSSEIRGLFKDDIGSIITSIGLLWCIGAFFRLHTEWDYTISSIVVGLGMAIFGYCLWEAGLFHAILITGLYMFFVAWFCTPFISRGTHGCLIIIGAILIIFSFSTKPFSKPTERTDEYYADKSDTKWYIWLDTYNGFQYEETFIGTMEEAKKRNEKNAKKWEARGGGKTSQKILRYEDMGVTHGAQPLF